MKTSLRIGMLMILALAGGCGKQAPVLSGGKPADYWVEALRHPDAQVRKKAATKLGNAGPITPRVLPALVEALSDADARVRCEAILALVKFGPAAWEASPTLAGLSQQDRDVRVRYYANEALAKLHREEPR
jgi:HEAT repeat protein